METPVSDDEIDQALPGFVLAVAAEAERLVLAARSGTETRLSYGPTMTERSSWDPMEIRL
jgi:hypothetical protein